MASNVRLQGDVKVWRELYSRLADAKVDVGVLAEKGGLETTSDGITMVELAAIHEYGSPDAGIPERSFIRWTFNNPANIKIMSDICAKLVKKFLRGAKLETSLGLLGAWAVGAIKTTIRSRIPPPNAKSTIARKGSSTPLVDTGRLLNSLSWIIRGSK